MKKFYFLGGRQRGFTLAELLVSISIVALFSIVLIPGFSGYGRRNTLLQSAQLIQTKIIQTKSLALAPRAGGGLGITEYRFIAPYLTEVLPGACPVGNNRYAIVEVFGSGLNMVECDSLGRDLNFTNSGNLTIVFSVERQGAITAPAGPTITFTVRHGRLTGSNTRNIVINRATGQVSIQ